MSINDIYNGKILEFAGNISHVGRLDAPDGTAKAHSKLCGSTVIVDVKADGDRLVDYAHDVKACALGQAAAAILANQAIGSDLSELRAARDGLKAMLKEGAEPPAGRFSDLAFLEPVRDYRARHASTMLAFEAVVEALENAVENAQHQASAPAA